MTTSPLTTVREVIRRVIQRFAASIMQRPLIAGDPELEASPDVASMHEVLANLVEACELLLHEDWEYTRLCLGDAYTCMVAPDGTFLEPGVIDESNNWGNRGAFLLAYRDAKALLERADGTDLEPVFDGDPEVEPSPTPKCLYATEYGHDWLLSHRWLAGAKAGVLVCRDCGERWPRPKGEGEA